MRGRGGVPFLSVLALVSSLTTARAEDPKPQPVDIKPFKAKLQLFQDAKGGTYAVLHEPDQDTQVFYGANKTLYQQAVVGGGADGDAWSINTFAPRLKEIRPASIERRHDGTMMKTCDGKDDAVLTPITGDKAKAVLDKYQFSTTAFVRRAHLLARDDNGIYYYVDKLFVKDDPHGINHRVFVGRKGAMKQLPLIDMASDSAGDVFSTKDGSLRLVRNRDDQRSSTTWVKGEKRQELTWLDLDVNSHLIYTDLGIYTFLGTLCDNL